VKELNELSFGDGVGITSRPPEGSPVKKRLALLAASKAAQMVMAFAGARGHSPMQKRKSREQCTASPAPRRVRGPAAQRPPRSADRCAAVPRWRKPADGGGADGDAVWSLLQRHLVHSAPDGTLEATAANAITTPPVVPSKRRARRGGW
jgi:hypothetical protein